MLYRCNTYLPRLTCFDIGHVEHICCMLMFFFYHCLLVGGLEHFSMYFRGVGIPPTSCVFS